MEKKNRKVVRIKFQQNTQKEYRRLDKFASFFVSFEKILTDMSLCQSRKYFWTGGEGTPFLF